MEKGFDYFANLTCKDDLEVAKTLIFLYSTSLVLRKKATKVIRSKLISLTALYLQFGYSRQTKKMAETVLGVTAGTIDHMNHELTDKGILFKDDDSDKNLNSELLLLQTNLKDSKGVRPPYFIFFVHEDEK